VDASLPLTGVSGLISVAADTIGVSSAELLIAMCATYQLERARTAKLRSNFGAMTPKHHRRPGTIKDQKTKPGTTNHNPVQSAKPPSPADPSIGSPCVVHQRSFLGPERFPAIEQGLFAALYRPAARVRARHRGRCTATLAMWCSGPSSNASRVRSIRSTCVATSIDLQG
jgi:hypothetical protein